MEGNHVFCITFPVLFFWDSGAADSTDSYSTQMAFSWTPHDGLLSLALVCLCSSKYVLFFIFMVLFLEVGEGDGGVGRM